MSDLTKHILKRMLQTTLAVIGALLGMIIITFLVCLLPLGFFSTALLSFFLIGMTGVAIGSYFEYKEDNKE